MFVTLTLNPAIDQGILVEGELSLNHLHQVKSETNTPGGKGINVAKMIAAIGKKVTVGGLLGQDQLDFYVNTLTPYGMTCRFLSLPHPTRINLMISDGKGREQKFNRSGFPDLPFDRAAVCHYAHDFANPNSVIIMSGSLPEQFPSDTYAILIRQFHAAGCLTVIDTSGPALYSALPEKPAVIKPNRHELEAILGVSLDSDAAMKQALRMLIRNHEAVIVSDGARGAWFAGQGQLWFANAPAVTCVDTTGAGDTLLGQFCADYFPACQLTPEIMANAVAAGAAAVEHLGTPAVSQSRVRELAQQVKIIRTS